MKALAREATLALGVLALLSGLVLADPKPGQKKKSEDGQKKVIIQLDASKLSPELLAQLVKAAGQADAKPGVKKPATGSPDGGKPGTKNQPDQPKPSVKKPVDGKPEVKKPVEDKGKSLTLALAIGYAEKYAQGIAYKAEYEGNGFVVLVKNDKGTTKVKMDALGNIAGDKGDEQKPRSKKK